jgi:molecular chaperone DnaK
MGTIAGIDLGTTYSALAALNEIGKPEIVPDLNGNRITPSVVAFNGKNSAIVGVDAKNKLSSDPSDIVQFVKRKMGDPSHRYSAGGGTHSPVEISAMILKKLKEECVQHGEIEDVVITVPAHFNEVERKSTMDAGKLAGLNVLGVVNEPTAAAIYYASLSPVNGNVVVYDLGGGTFDVTILNIQGDKMDILSSKGNGHLGGVDFDNALTRHMITNARKDLGKELFPDHFFETMPNESSDESKSYFKIMDNAEKAKKQLSARDKSRANTTTHHGDNLRIEVHRSDFEEMISSHLVTTEMLLENALEDAGLSAGDIDKVLLVGGSTRIPKVSQMLEAFFGFAPEKSMNPDEAVALGAAIMAGKRKMKATGGVGVPAAVRAEVGKTSVLECANRYFGTITIGHNEARGEVMNQNFIIIKSGAKIPCEEMEDFATVMDNQKTVNIRVTECEEEEHDPEHVKVIGTFPLDLPLNCPRGSRIGIGYGYDEDQRLKVRVELPDGETFEGDLHYDNEGNLTQSKMQKAAAKLNEFVVE